MFKQAVLSRVSNLWEEKSWMCMPVIWLTEFLPQVFGFFFAAVFLEMCDCSFF